MPSGPKRRRKAAKKKKEEEGASTNPDSPQSHGEDELKHHNGKGSDCEEVSSPASQDQPNQRHPFSGADSEKMEKRNDNSFTQTSVDANKSGEEVNKEDRYRNEVAVEGGGVVQIEREMQHQAKSESRDASSEYVKATTKSSDGSSSSSSSSSDDESHAAVDKNIVVEITSSDNPADCVSEEPTRASKIVPLNEDSKPVVEPTPVIDSDSTSVLNEDAHKNGTATTESMIPDVTESGITKISEHLALLEEETKEVQSLVMDSTSQLREDVLSSSDKNSVLPSDSKNSVSGLCDDKLPTATSTVVAEHMKDPAIPDSPENQPQVAHVSRAAQTTSWKSCCGLLELFTSGNR